MQIGDCQKRIKKLAMGRFVVDVNGDKGPNVFGYDVFSFVLLKGKGIVPEGFDDVSKCYLPDGSGGICTAQVIMDKKIDYPRR